MVVLQTFGTGMMTSHNFTVCTARSLIISVQKYMHKPDYCSTGEYTYIAHYVHVQLVQCWHRIRDRKADKNFEQPCLSKTKK